MLDAVPGVGDIAMGKLGKVREVGVEKDIKKWGDMSDWEGDWWLGEASWRRRLEVQEVGMGRGGDRAFQVGEQGAEGGEGCGGWVQGIWAGVRLTEGLHVLERVWG